MTSEHREFEVFIRRVRRRFVVLRLLERTGLGVLLSCAAAVPLVLIAIWRGQAALPLAAATLVVGALGGLLWGILTRPGELESAMEADRQLNWADLLASAWSVADRRDDPWASAVISAADLRCRQASTSSVVLNRLGARAWGGIGLAAALVLALGIFPTYSTPSAAQNRFERFSTLLPSNPNPEPPAANFPGRTARRTALQPEPEDAMNRRFADEHASHSEGHADASRTSADEHARSQSVANDHSQGAGAGHTDVKDSGHVPDPRRSTSGTPSEPGGTPSGGTGRSASAAQGKGAQGGIASDESPANAVPPWQSSGWPSDVKHAHDAIDSGRVPDAYRDVVRGYFNRP